VSNDYSADALLNFLDHAADKGLMPAATAQALAVASRNLMPMMGDGERADLRTADLDGVIKRFTNKRAHDFSPASLKEYGNRIKRAVGLFVSWRDDPASFTVKTRATKGTTTPKRASASSAKANADANAEAVPVSAPPPPIAPMQPGSYSTSFPVRPGCVVTLTNVPGDLTSAEAERLAGFVRLLGA
jgi:hypothetical protein